MQGKRAKVNSTKTLQKFLNFTILFTDLDWQRKVKWFRALKFENQAMGTRVTDILNFFKKNFKIKSTNFDVNDANDENDENLIRQG